MTGYIALDGCIESYSLITYSALEGSGPRLGLLCQSSTKGLDDAGYNAQGAEPIGGWVADATPARAGPNQPRVFKSTARP
jgi:hypothetical protein